MKPQPFTIECEAFDDLREKTNAALNAALRQMNQYKISTGTLALNIEIELNEETDENGETILMPEFYGRVSISLPMKAKMDLARKAGMVMTRDPAGDGFIVADGQYSMFDLLEEQKEES